LPETTIRPVKDDDVPFLFGLLTGSARQWHRMRVTEVPFAGFAGRLWSDLFAAYILDLGGSPVGYAGAYDLDAVHRHCWVELVLAGLPSTPGVVDGGCLAVSRVVDHVVEAAGAGAFYAYATPGSAGQAVFEVAGGWESSGALAAYDFAGGCYHDRLIFHRLVDR
jgi:hypothetical protein